MDEPEKPKEPEKPAEPEKPVPAAQDKVMLEKIDMAASRLEAANKKADHLRALADAEKTEAALAGTAGAGNPEKPPEMTDKEYADKIMAGDVPGKT